MKGTPKINTVDDYLALFRPEVRKTLEEMRNIIKNAAPQAEERIGYQMPAYFQNGVLVYFAGQAKHIGFYPGASGIEAFNDELKGYETSKGTIRIPYDKPLPRKLISDIVKFRLSQNLEKARIKKQKK